MTWTGIRTIMVLELRQRVRATRATTSNDAAITSGRSMNPEKK